MRYTNSTPASVREALQDGLTVGRNIPRRMVAQMPAEYPLGYAQKTTQELEDAKLTGATRSLTTRLLALNLHDKTDHQVFRTL